MFTGTGCDPVAILMSIGVFHGEGAADRTSIPPDGRLVAVAILNDHRIAGELMTGGLNLTTPNIGMEIGVGKKHTVQVFL